MKKRIYEAVGVPENIINSAIKLFDEIVNYLSSLDDIHSRDEYSTELKSDFRISDMKLKNVKFKIQFVKKGNEDFAILLMGQSNKNFLNDKFRVEAEVDENETNIRMMLLTPIGFENDELLEFFTKNRNILIPIIAHELKHGYDEFKNNLKKVSDVTEYTIYSKSKFGKIKPLNDFLYFSYYIHNIENLVRPTEMAAHIKMQKITPKQFYDFFTKNEIFKTLKNIRNFSLKNLKEELKGYENVIDDVLKSINETYNNVDEKIDRILELFYYNLVNWKNDQLINFIYPVDPSSPIFKIFQSDENDKYIDKYARNLSKYVNNYEDFYLDEEKYFQYTAFKMIKKLGRLYELTQENIMENKSIWNWEKHQEYFGEKNVISKNIKSKDELISEIIKRIKKKTK